MRWDITAFKKKMGKEIRKLDDVRGFNGTNLKNFFMSEKNSKRNWNEALVEICRKCYKAKPEEFKKLVDDETNGCRLYSEPEMRSDGKTSRRKEVADGIYVFVDNDNDIKSNGKIQIIRNIFDKLNLEYDLYFEIEI